MSLWNILRTNCNAENGYCLQLDLLITNKVKKGFSTFPFCSQTKGKPSFENTGYMKNSKPKMYYPGEKICWDHSINKKSFLLFVLSKYIITSEEWNQKKCLKRKRGSHKVYLEVKKRELSNNQLMSGRARKRIKYCHLSEKNGKLTW